MTRRANAGTSALRVWLKHRGRCITPELLAMSTIRPFLRGCRYRLTSGQSYASRSSRRRYFSERPDDIAPEASQKTRSRIERINIRLPRFLQRYTKPLVTAPLTHISAFLLLHELTAVVPLLGLAGIFHYSRWLPPYISEGQWVSSGVEKFGRYFRRKGWLGETGVSRRDRYWGLSERGVRVVVE